MKNNDLVLSLSKRLILLLCLFLVCFMLTMGASYVVGRLLAGRPEAAMRISAVIQDVVAFIIPAVTTALIITRRPAELLCLDRKPAVMPMAAIVVLAVVSIPALEAVIYWNYHWTFPDFMHDFAEAARAMEDAATQAMASLLADTSASGLIVNILIVGVFAGLSEELLFRGCFQRLLTTGGVNRHVAIWLVAVCFSAMHFQLFGFVPRILLGAYFGYLLVWTSSIWVPVTAHILNNTMYVVLAWTQARSGGIGSISDEPQLWSLGAIAASVVVSATILAFLYRYSVTRQSLNA